MILVGPWKKDAVGLIFPFLQLLWTGSETTELVSFDCSNNLVKLGHFRLVMERDVIVYQFERSAHFKRVFETDNCRTRLSERDQYQHQNWSSKTTDTRNNCK